MTEIQKWNQSKWPEPQDYELDNLDEIIGYKNNRTYLFDLKQALYYYASVVMDRTLIVRLLTETRFAIPNPQYAWKLNPNAQHILKELFIANNLLDDARRV